MLHPQSKSGAIRPFLPPVIIVGVILAGCAASDVPPQVHQTHGAMATPAAQDAAAGPVRAANQRSLPIVDDRPDFLKPIPADMSLDELRAHAAVRPPITVPAAQLPYRIPAGSLGAGLNRLVVETSGQPVILLAPALEAGMPGRHIIRPQSVHQGLAEFIVDLSVDAPMDGWSIESPGNY